ncbi:MAG: hypothetical protein ACTIKC_01970 [Psychrobacter sp.]
MTKLHSIELLLNSNHGQFIPSIFASDFDMTRFNIDLGNYDKEALQDVGHEWYWEAWQTIEDNAYLLDDNGNKYTLLLDGDLWLVCYELMTDEEKLNFFDEY